MLLFWIDQGIKGKYDYINMWLRMSLNCILLVCTKHDNKGIGGKLD